MKFLSLFSGIGGFDLGLERVGMTCAGQVEKDAFCLRVLEKHWPGVPRESDVYWTKGKPYQDSRLLCGGFPCQDLSVAGDRAGLAGRQSRLFFEIPRILEEQAFHWVLVENVPGLLSSHGGRDMAAVIGALARCGYGWAYRVLDAQYFGLAQRRKRLFLVGCRGDPGRAAQVLFEPESLPGDSPAGQEKKTEISGTLGGGSGQRGWCNDLDRSGAFVPAFSRCDTTGEGRRHDAESCTFLAFHPTPDPITGKISPCLGVKERGMGVASRSFVRRLMPVECCRLQGFPDDWLDLHPPLSDSQQYRMLGNAVAVPVVEWIGQRILRFDAE